MRDVAYRDIVTGRRTARAGGLKRVALFGRLMDATGPMIKADRTEAAYAVLCAWTAWADRVHPLETGPVDAGRYSRRAL